MNAADLITTVVIAALLVTVLIVAVSHFGPRLETRRRQGLDASGENGSWFFVRFRPDGEDDAGS